MRPILLTVEWEQINHPVGYPRVTSMRPMTWWETLKHKKLKKQVNTALLDNIQVSQSNFNVAIEISKEQYTKLLLGDPKSMQALGYLKGQAATLQLIPPVEAQSINETYKEQQV